MTVCGISPTTKDTLRLAQAAQPTIAAFGILHAAGRIPAAALVDLRYRFAAWCNAGSEDGESSSTRLRARGRRSRHGFEAVVSS